jgi:polysaccharide deacetylase family protein (PEP-CTERM system associated)
MSSNIAHLAAGLLMPQSPDFADFPNSSAECSTIAGMDGSGAALRLGERHLETDLKITRCPTPGPALHASTAAPQCAFTVDVEDWYQSCIDYDAAITERVIWNVARVRKLLDECGVKATFFILGRVAEVFPRLLQDLVAEGHEIQSHGYSHLPLYTMDRKALRRELDYARKTIEDACGVRVTAFRAPRFSIHRENLWALEVLAETGFEVDSSIFPVRTRVYGIPGWEQAPHRIALANGAEILEVPVAIWNAGPFHVPVAGGGYFRLLPQPILEHALRSIVRSQRPVITYCHPYEFNPREPHDYRGQVPASYRYYQTLGRGSFIKRMRYLLTHLSFGRFDEVLTTWKLQ